jgi:hypothetical protein
MTQTDWGVRHLELIAATIKGLRGKHSAQWLSDQTEALGYKVSRSTITDIENGRRKYISTAELSVIAWALCVAPVRLLYPNLPDGDVEVIPSVPTASIHAATWFSGETTFEPKMETEEQPVLDDGQPNDDLIARIGHISRLHYGNELVRLSRERLRLDGEIKSLAALIARFEAADNPVVVKRFTDESISAQALLKTIEHQLRLHPDAVLTDNN